MNIQEALTTAARHHQAGRLAQAEAIYRQVLAAHPHQPDALHLLGMVALQTGHLDAALGLIERSLQAAPAFETAHHNLVLALDEHGRRDEAIAACRRGVAAVPGSAMLHNTFGTLLLEQGRYEEAALTLRRAIELEPENALAHSNLGMALKELGRLDEAIAVSRRAVALDPQSFAAHNNLGDALKEQGQVEEAIACLRRAFALRPAAAVHSNLLAVLHYSSRVTPADLLDAHREYNRLHAQPLRGPAVSHTEGRPLRLGFVSPHFSRHPVGHFIVRLLENLDIEVICYSDTAAADEMTGRIRAACTHWRDVARLSDQQLADQIRADAVDILFDLAGHTAGNRLLVFARKPAPIQVSWCDYVGTTGLSAMDYLLADPREISPEAERWCSEKVLRMPDSYICFDPPPAPDVGPLPALRTGQVTFGSFNILAKTGPEVIAAWARILHRVPGSRLLMKNRGLDEPATAARFRRLFAEQGINEDRLGLRGWSPTPELLAAYNEVDLALDTFPYNGGLTTCEALWMGVPVVTFPGDRFAGRHGLAHLTAAGVPETIARDLEGYINLAVELAGDLPRLATIRAALRGRVAASPLCDGQRFARHFAALMREAAGALGN